MVELFVLLIRNVEHLLVNTSKDHVKAIANTPLAFVSNRTQMIAPDNNEWK